ncbi:DUF3990 domain-containing protein [Oscillibacter sp. GMB15532]|uniref:DUF3990 domain-containing protein n=1 Tax=Oscillibacter sp. GMB15532 TaxID=3230022 RepID=UPI0034E00488
MEHTLTLFHGSPQIIEAPELAKGKPNNDYGRGFYCTESMELAKEWACSTETDGFANRYAFEPTNLSVLNLSSGEYHILNWLSILLENRTFRMSGDIAQRAKDYIFEHFMIEYKSYDVIKGYRADDSYFSFATAFLNNTISLAQLEKAMVLGNLGEQVVLRSQAAFDRLTFVESTAAPRAIYLPKKLARDTEARAEFKQEKTKPSVEDEVYILDIIRGRWQNDDPRIQRILLG